MSTKADCMPGSTRVTLPLYMEPARVYSFSRSKNTSTTWSSSTTASLVSCGVEVTNSSFDMLSPGYYTGLASGEVMEGTQGREQGRAVPTVLALAEYESDFDLSNSLHLRKGSAWCGRTPQNLLEGAVIHPGTGFLCKSFPATHFALLPVCPFITRGRT